MTETPRTRDIDQAALVLAFLVAGWQITDQSGPWGLINIPIGLVLLLIISAYSNPTLDRKFKGVYLQVAAVAVGISFAICMILAFPAQALIYLITAKWWGWEVSGDQLGDYTTNIAFPIILLIAVPLIYRRILRWIKTNEEKAGAPNSKPRNTPPAHGAASPAILLFAIPWNHWLIRYRENLDSPKTDTLDANPKSDNSAVDESNSSRNMVTADQDADVRAESSVDSHACENFNKDLASEDPGHVTDSDDEKATLSVPAVGNQQDSPPVGKSRASDTPSSGP